MKYNSYRILCSAAGCDEEARYKIAAEWTDGTLVELKPYAFSCPGHLAELFEMAKGKRDACRLSPGESLEPVGIYDLDRNRGDRKLRRRPDLEGD